MINKRSIDAYLARPIESFDGMKTISDGTLNELLAEEDAKADGLWLHQKVCLLLALVANRFMFHVDMGGGKTRIMLEAIAHRKGSRAIVFVPYLAATETWVAECKKHTPRLRCVALTGSTQENHAAIMAGEGDVFVIAYQSAVALVTDKEGGGKWTLTPSRVQECFQGFDTLILDRDSEVFVTPIAYLPNV